MQKRECKQINKRIINRIEKNAPIGAIDLCHMKLFHYTQKKKYLLSYRNKCNYKLFYVEFSH